MPCSGLNWSDLAEDIGDGRDTCGKFETPAQTLRIEGQGNASLNSSRIDGVNRGLIKFSARDGRLVALAVEDPPHPLPLTVEYHGCELVEFPQEYLNCSPRDRAIRDVVDQILRITLVTAATTTILPHLCEQSNVN